MNGIFAPARTPPQIIAKLNADIISVIRSPEMQQRFRDLEVQTVTSTPKEFDAFIKQDVVRWATVVRRAGIKLEQGN